MSYRVYRRRSRAISYIAENPSQLAEQEASLSPETPTMPVVLEPPYRVYVKRRRSKAMFGTRSNNANSLDVSPLVFASDFAGYSDRGTSAGSVVSPDDSNAFSGSKDSAFEHALLPEQVIEADYSNFPSLEEFDDGFIDFKKPRLCENDDQPSYLTGVDLAIGVLSQESAVESPEMKGPLHITNEDPIFSEPFGLLTPASTSARNSSDEVGFYQSFPRRPRTYHPKPKVRQGRTDTYMENLRDDACRSKSRTASTTREMNNTHVDAPITPELLFPKKPFSRKRNNGVTMETSAPGKRALSKRKNGSGKNSRKSCKRLLIFDSKNDATPCNTDMNNGIGCLYNSLDAYKSVFCNPTEEYFITKEIPVVVKKRSVLRGKPSAELFPEFVTRKKRSKRIAKRSFSTLTEGQYVVTEQWSSQSTREGNPQICTATASMSYGNSTDVPQHEQIMLQPQTPKPRKARQIRARVVKEKLQQRRKSTPMRKYTENLEKNKQSVHGIDHNIDPIEQHEQPSKGKSRKGKKSKEKTGRKRKGENSQLALVGTNDERWQIYHGDDLEVILHHLVQRIEALSMDEDSSLKNAIIPFEQNNEVKKNIGKVNLDPETLRMWNRLMIKGKTTEEEEDDMEKKKYWENERKTYRGRVDSFIARMHVIQGDRRFSPWKGSVMDSVIGVFLTQNTSDHLSSSAYMSLLAEFPPQKDNEGKESVDTSLALQVAENSHAPQNGELSNLAENLISKIELANLIETRDSQADEREVKFESKSKNTIKIGRKKKLFDEDQDFSIVSERKKSGPRIKSKKERVEEDEENWDKIRDLYCSYCGPRHIDHRDSADWEAVRCAPVKKLADTIAIRGQHNIIAGRIQELLNNLKTRHKNLDLEWLRNAPGDTVKDYLQRVYGLGLKSVECVRLLTLQQKAFPVDVNVARIAVRLGWVPLKLPENFQLHLLDVYPSTDTIQKYLWPRLCELNEETLYELHYQMITWGKSFCVKAQPNCKECPLKGECKYYASKAASERQALPASAETGVVSYEAPRPSGNSLTYLQLEVGPSAGYTANHHEPIIEMPASPRPDDEEPLELIDIEDYFQDDTGEIFTLKLNAESNVKWWDDKKMEYGEKSESMALVALSEEAASRPSRKLKNTNRLRTEREVYELPDDHPLLKDFLPREPDDPSPYLFAMWTEEEVADSNEGINNQFNATNEELSSTVPGTILIPCRTAMRARFPLNGTYFQVNEVFADHQSSVSPLRIPRALIWNCSTRTVYFGTSTTTILRGLTLEAVQYCFWRGNVCVRGFERQTLKPEVLDLRFHRPTGTRMGKKNTNTETNVELKKGE